MSHAAFSFGTSRKDGIAGPVFMRFAAGDEGSPLTISSFKDCFVLLPSIGLTAGDDELVFFEVPFFPEATVESEVVLEDVEDAVRRLRLRGKGHEVGPTQ